MPNTNKNIWVRSLDVPGYERHAKGYTIYQIIWKVYSCESPEVCTQVTVWKRFTDICIFHKAMCELHRALFLKGTLPKLPIARYFNRLQPEVIEMRRSAISDFFHAVALHTPLFKTELFIKFFENGERTTINQMDMITEPTLMPLPSVRPSAVDECDADSASTSSQTASSASTGLSHCSTESPDMMPCLQRQQQQQHRDSMSSAMSDAQRTDQSSTGSDTDLGTLVPHLATLSSANSSPIDDEVCISSESLSLDAGHVTAVADTDSAMSKNSSVDGGSEASHSKNPSIDGGIETVTGNEKSRSTPSLSGSDATGDYLIKGTTEISLAQELDSQGEYWEALNQYSKGIGTLLNGVQGDVVRRRRKSVRAQLVTYLDRAEQLDVICRSMSSAESPQKLYRQCSAPPIGLDKQLLPTRRYSGSCSCCVRDSAAGGKAGVWLCSAGRLARYRVVGVRGRLLCVLDTATGERRVIKVVRKCGGLSLGRCSTTFLPENVPYMVHLYECIETYSTYYLVLEDLGDNCSLLDYIRDNCSPVESVCPSSDMYANSGIITHSEDPSSNELAPSSNESLSDAANVCDGVASVTSECREHLNESPTVTPPGGGCDNYLSVFEEYAQSSSRVQLAQTVGRCSSIGCDSIADNGGIGAIEGLQSFASDNVPLVESNGNCTASNNGEIQTVTSIDSAPTEDIIEQSRRLLSSVNSTIKSPFAKTCSRSTPELEEAEKSGPLPVGFRAVIDKFSLVGCDLDRSRDSPSVNGRVSRQSCDSCLSADGGSILSDSGSGRSVHTDTSAYSASQLVPSDLSSAQGHEIIRFGTDLTCARVGNRVDRDDIHSGMGSGVGGEIDGLVVESFVDAGGGDCEGYGQGEGCGGVDQDRGCGGYGQGEGCGGYGQGEGCGGVDQDRDCGGVDQVENCGINDYPSAGGDVGNINVLSTCRDSISCRDPTTAGADYSAVDALRSDQHGPCLVTSVCDSNEDSDEASLSDSVLPALRSSATAEKMNNNSRVSSNAGLVATDGDSEVSDTNPEREGDGSDISISGGDGVSITTNNHGICDSEVSHTSSGRGRCGSGPPISNDGINISTNSRGICDSAISGTASLGGGDGSSSSITGCSGVNISTNDRTIRDDNFTLESAGSQQLNKCICSTEDSSPASAVCGVSEQLVRVWIAQLVVCLERLHQLGITCGGLTFDNLLITKRQKHFLGRSWTGAAVKTPQASTGVKTPACDGVKTPISGGTPSSSGVGFCKADCFGGSAKSCTRLPHASASHSASIVNAELRLTYFCRLRSVWRDPPLVGSPRHHVLSVGSLIAPSSGPEADWHSLGSILFRLLTGCDYCTCKLLEHHQLSPPASDLLQTLLSPQVTVSKVKQHHFFNGIVWQRVAVYRY